jgi:hypothetical protein
VEAFMNETKIVLSMAFSRNIWINKFRQRFEGTLKEYTKLYLVKQLGLQSFWDVEVANLAKRVTELLDPTRRKGSWDIYKAAAEAFVDASGEQVKCREALNDFKHYDEYTEEDIKKIYKFWSQTLPDSTELSLEILEKYFPKEHKERIVNELQKL